MSVNLHILLFLEAVNQPLPIYNHDRQRYLVHTVYNDIYYIYYSAAMWLLIVPQPKSCTHLYTHIHYIILRMH